MYGVALTVSKSSQNGEASVILVKFLSIIRRGTTPCYNWPAGLICSPDQAGEIQEQCVLEFTPSPIFQDFEFAEDEITDSFVMSINGAPVGRVLRPDPGCLMRGNNTVTQISYQGTGASHVYSCY